MASKLAKTLIVAAALLPGAVSAQAFGNSGNGGFMMASADGPLFQARILEHPMEVPTPMIGYVGRYIVVQLEENRVYVFDGDRAIWSAPAGTGTGLDLKVSTEHQWKFSTPRGIMEVQRMEKDPVWEAPDWWYPENGLPIPPPGSPPKKIAGVMGHTAVYLGDGIAIHGTGSPQLLMNPDPKARNVSHGCIRLTDEAARELLHMVDVGTPVLIY